MKNDTFVKIQWWDFVVSGFCFLMWVLAVLIKAFL